MEKLTLKALNFQSKTQCSLFRKIDFLCQNIFLWSFSQNSVEVSSILTAVVEFILSYFTWMNIMGGKRMMDDDALCVMQ